MKRKAAAIVATLVGVISTLALMGASVAVSPSATPSKTRTFKFVFLFSDAQTRIDLGGAGSTTGDPITFTGPVNDNSGRRVGFGQGQCVITLPTRPLSQCTTSLFFDHGQIATQGPNYFNRPFNHAITGGTGVFRTAGGEMRAAPLPNDAGWRITLQVIR